VSAPIPIATASRPVTTAASLRPLLQNVGPFWLGSLYPGGATAAGAAVVVVDEEVVVDELVVVGACVVEVRNVVVVCCWVVVVVGCSVVVVDDDVLLEVDDDEEEVVVDEEVVVSAPAGVWERANAPSPQTAIAPINATKAVRRVVPRRITPDTLPSPSSVTAAPRSTLTRLLGVDVQR
jgi:hypothetical protein